MTTTPALNTEKGNQEKVTKIQQNIDQLKTMNYFSLNTEIKKKKLVI